MTDFTKFRQNMIKGQLLPGGVVDPRIIDSFAALPREMFVLEKMQEIAYLDENIPLGQGRYIVKPLAHALLIQHAAPRMDDIVLDVGSASGYSSAVLSPLVTTVIAIEHNRRQMDKASRIWEKLELCNIAMIEKDDLRNGYKEGAPYSLIIINGSVPKVPDAILDQLAPKGRLACFIKEENNSESHAALYYKSHNGAVSSKVLFDAAVPYIGDFIEPEAFIF